ncbi:MAG TPA: hypothetical protein VKU41_16240 [Polyangiaceae bacterium]|nr:hypothetical protein [Polyangiaceae bacterium]
MCPNRTPAKATAIGAFLAALVYPAVASAGERRVVLVDVDPPVARALLVTLSPWDIVVYTVTGPVPETDARAALFGARALALAQHADAVVWLRPQGEADPYGSLWVYDAQTEQLSIQPLTMPTSAGDASAASVALSVKTLLRAGPAAMDTAPPPPPRASARLPAEKPAVAPEPRSSEWRLETTVGVRSPTGGSDPVEPDAALALSLWPGGHDGHFGLGIAVRAGPGVGVTVPGFEGTFRDASVDATARLRTGSRGVAIELDAGPALLMTSFDGEATSGPTSVSAVRLNPAADVFATLSVAPSARIAFGVLIGTSMLLRFQRYSLLPGAALLEEPPVEVFTGLRVSLEVD